MVGQFYPNGAKAPKNMPKYLIVVDNGAYAFNYVEDCWATAKQFRANGINHQMMVREGI
jgi:hypothetical protein